MQKRIILSIAILFVFQLNINAQENVDAVMSFAKAYGYVKYFHPSTEVREIDWDRFSAYGASEMLKCKSSKDVISSLHQLFTPVGPAVKFSRKQGNYNLRTITPAAIEGYRLTYWQHLGVSSGMQYKFPSNAYRSVLVNQLAQAEGNTEIAAEPIFDDFPKFGELVDKKIGNKLYCQIPLTLYFNGKDTYPKSESLKTLQDLVSGISTDPTDLSVRLGNVINVYNVIEHFYPYFDEVEVDWDKELEKALKRCFVDRTQEDHLITLEKFTASIRDGHLWIWQGASPYKYYPDIQWEWIQDSLVITEVLDANLNIEVGDVVSHVNKRTAKEYFEEVNSRISYGTIAYLNYGNSFRSLSREEGTSLVLKVNNVDIELQHDRKVSDYKFKPIKIQENDYLILDDDIMYINLDAINMDTLTALIPQLTKMKGIVADFRGHNYLTWDFLTHYSKDSIQDGWISAIPQFIYPNQEKIVGYDESTGFSKAKEPYLGDVKTIFLMDGRTKSASESFMSTVKYSNLGIIVGEQSAGANGNMNPFKILGDYTIWWTGMKITNPDGSQFHCLGITPDVIVKKTIEGVRQGKDESLEKAIELIKE